MTLRRPMLALFATLLAFPLAASAETIDNFAVHATLDANDRAIFHEDITYDFGSNDRHGIERYIPTNYTRYGANYGLNLSFSDITQDGASAQYQLTSDGGTTLVRIGDPNVTMEGQHEYGLTYATTRAINFFPDHDELYWNVTGNDWQVPIEQSTFFLTLPPGISDSSVSTTCFTGVQGSTEQACSAQVSDGAVQFKATRVLQAGEGLTIVVGIPKGFVHQPTAWEDLVQLLIDNKVLFFPLIVFVIMFGLWWTRGRDPKLGTVIPQYDPPDQLAPALIQVVWSYGNAGDRAITATIIDLAQRGYLRIDIAGTDDHPRAKDFTMVKLKEADDTMQDFETTLFKGIFATSASLVLSDLQAGKFYQTALSFKSLVQTHMDQMQVFDKNPNKVRGGFFAAGFLLAVGAFFLPGIPPTSIAACIFSGLIICFFGYLMPRRNAKGTDLEARIDGFKWFLSVTETDRMAFHDAPAKRPEQFSQYLPYAIIFGVEKKWAEQFAGMDIPPPHWIHGNGAMNAIYLSNAMGSFHQGAQSMYAPPRSAGGGGSGFGGGGFSGGGMGGGGGGSW